MSESSDGPQSRADDPDWIKGLVAQALIKAAESEQSAAPITGSPAPVTGSPDATPTTAPVSTPGVVATPGNVPTQSLTDPGGRERPLIVGRAGPQQWLPPVSEPPGRPVVETSASTNALGPQPNPGVPLATRAEANRLPGPRPAPIHQRDYQSPAVAVADYPPNADLAGPSDLADDSASLSSQGPTQDELMEHEDVITEGFRSSDIRTILEWLAVIVSALVVALVIKAFVLQAFYIPSESMETTVNEGDRILVNKISYQLHDVRRGDLVVFKHLPGTPSQTDDLIKRAIALPGETIEVRSDGRIWIWGPGETAEDAKRLEEPYLDPQNELLQAPDASMAASQDAWHENCENQPRTPGRCTLGDDEYFMMGDNRGASSDSRSFGPITEDLIVGRAFLRIWPLGEFSPL